MLSKTEFRELPIFITSMSRWDGDTSSASLALAKVFGRTNPVYYIDFPYSYIDVWRERKLPGLKQRVPSLLWGKDPVHSVQGQPENLKSVTPKMVLPFYNMAPGRMYRFASHQNSRKMARVVKRVLREHNIGHYLFLNSFNPSYLANINQYLDPVLSIYQSRDAIEATHVPSIGRENDCVNHYDLTLGTSTQICRNIERRTGRKAAYLPNGGDVALFRTAMEQVLKRPAELQSICGPIIGYTGAICQRIDYELLVKLATANPDKTFVLVGPRRDKQHTTINLDAVRNIVFTGPKKLEELPAYLRCFDCAIIPFKCNELTAGIYPLKINEYLAAGKAVVTTNFSQDVASFQPHIYLADGHEDFLQKTVEAIDANSREKQVERGRAAGGNSWENRVERFWELAWSAYQMKVGKGPNSSGLESVRKPIHKNKIANEK